MANDLTLYTYRRPLIRTGDAILWQSDTLLGKAIQIKTGSRYNHVSIAIRFSQYDKDHVFVLEELETGAQLNSLSARLRDHKGNAWLFPLAEDFDVVRVGMGKTALSLIGTPYDYLGLFANLAGRISVDARNMICSEYYWIALSKQALPTIDLRKKMALLNGELTNHAPTPADFPLFQKYGIMGKEVSIL